MSSELTQLTNEQYWCFDCQSVMSSLSLNYTCSKCSSEAVEEITPENDPRKHVVPSILSAAPSEEDEEEQEISVDIFSHVVRMGDHDVTVTIINTSRDGSTPLSIDMLDGLRQFNVLRMLGGLFANQNDDTPATDLQMEKLEKADTVECSICQEDENHDDGLKLPCGHTFHI